MRNWGLAVAKLVNTSEQVAELRQRAEEMAERHAAPPSVDPEATLPTWVADMLHELRVHQIELEMQNEELRRAQGRLDDLSARYFDLYNLAPHGYFSLDEFGLILETNLYAAARLGVSRVALVGQPFTRFVARADQDSFYLHRRKLAEAGAAENWELRMVRQDGTEFWAHLEATAAQEADGSPVLRIAMGDISERKHAEEERRHLEAELHHAQSMESLGALTVGIANDMNNTLGAILGTASANLNTQPADSPAHRAFDLITRASERGARLVQSLLNLSRRQPAEEKKLDLNLILLDIVHLLEHSTFKQFQIETVFPSDLSPILGDANALAKAFMNLFINAADAMAPGGTLTLRTRNLGSTQIEVQVEDTGAGMSAETLAQARDPFFTTKDVGKGTGLGLPIVDSIIKDHGGRMDIQSEPGHGTLVILRIPALAKPGQTDAPAQVSGEGGNQGALKVLVVDDDDLVRGSMETLLECLGHAVVTRPYGEDALAIIETGFIPDVVILDMDLPDLGGTRTLLRLRTMLPDVPVLIATGLVDRATLDLIDLHPGVSLLPKPFSAGALQQELDRLVVV